MFVTVSILSLLISATTETSTVEVLTQQGEWVDALIDENGTIHSENGIDLGSTALAWIPKSDGVGTIERRPFSMTKLTDGQVIIATFGGFHIEPIGTIARWKHPGMGMSQLSLKALASNEKFRSNELRELRSSPDNPKSHRCASGCRMDQ
jgi:hypothetical protein